MCFRNFEFSFLWGRQKLRVTYAVDSSLTVMRTAVAKSSGLKTARTFCAIAFIVLEIYVIVKPLFSYHTRALVLDPRGPLSTGVYRHCIVQCIDSLTVLTLSLY